MLTLPFLLSWKYAISRTIWIIQKKKENHFHKKKTKKVYVIFDRAMSSSAKYKRVFHACFVVKGGFLFHFFCFKCGHYYVTHCSSRYVHIRYTHVHGKNLSFSIDQYPPVYYIFLTTFLLHFCVINRKQFFDSDVKYLYEIFNAHYFSCFDVGIVCNFSSSVTDFPCPIPKSGKRKQERRLILPNFTVYCRYSRMKMEIISIVL